MLFTDTGEMDKFVTLDHGSGGRLTGKLIKEIFASKFGMKEPFTDSAVLDIESCEIAFTTDSYVIDPVFFPGGNIGRLAVCGTVNDLSVAGAVPLYLAASFIIEEGFPVEELAIIADSMAEEAARAGVRIVAGDTKVVEKGKCDRIFITTTGTGLMRKEFWQTGSGAKVRQGDKLIINGSVGNHSIAVMGARQQLRFTSSVVSDCASLNNLIGKVLDATTGINYMRDLTRGGLATVLNELAAITSQGIEISEQSIPVDEPVRGLCEMMGFDPLYLANEGKVLFVVGEKYAGEIVEILRSDPLGKDAAVIGEITGNNLGMVIMKTITGGSRIIDLHSGTLLPRIC